MGKHLIDGQKKEIVAFKFTKTMIAKLKAQSIIRGIGRTELIENALERYWADETISK